jgi:hypothetical protein
MSDYYRKKPVVIEARQWDGSEESARSIKAWADSHGSQPLGGWSKDVVLLIRTLEGQMRAVPGDWIIRGVKGEFYPCKPDVFEATYEEARDD